ncbi:response regulator transcription factor [Nocardioides sp. BP30]|uniref:response regulator transcription factor n=1 Tax=Nocardioides sp. BP30 TaxID=3036374 RepID=UPI002468F8A4|nr:response regulator transcription factor [Nocardioides sp. BP30]WGL52456.1 response regulator transcription factor [Nocardioides sp. BP30]
MSIAAGEEPVRVVIAEDAALLREGLIRLFDEAGFPVVAAYSDGDSLLAALSTTSPHVAVLDVRMPPTFRDEGLRVALALRRQHPDIGVLLLSQYAEVDYARELLAAGPRGVGYLLKEGISSLAELREAVRRIAGGGTVLDPQLISALLSRQHDPLSRLTAREREVLEQMAQGRTNQGIADALHLAVASVEKHSTAIFAKLDLEASRLDHRRVLAVLTWLQR